MTSGLNKNAGRTGKDGQMSTTEQDDNRTAEHPLSTLTQQGGLSQMKARMKTREQ